ncbi:adenosylcobinamide-phosphate synthase CbiB [Aliiroseovarius subalbicans]|uniref:adenosylcobinamide-phosphate synthase CbiB n=1 Tax=Aliiroseovarius subalbicans TaxID=2925840 RepID=UPI001F5749C1|nr:adenosylcobinamide-phosphate synthase CbiB [uncultured Aliiroseovarius sp.]MCI2399762.1 adenosylcobinamide-phosphate synthase CbiB [Aliiroseovarius subalbicans]
MSHAVILLGALLLDAALGEPAWLWSRLPHPAVLMGRAIGALEQRLNHGERRLLAGALGLGALVVVAWLLGLALTSLGPLVELVIAAILMAQKSLVQHVGAVADALRISIGDGRHMVARIVGRDTAQMDAPAVARAAIESAAENLSDGVIAPAFWFLIFGLPGLLVYKLVNTADSMIGHRNPRYEQFGKAAARLDDVLNWVPARLTAVLIVLGYGRWDAWRHIRRDAPLHRSPNAGWPEAAMAAVLNVALSGPRAYDGERRDFPWVHPEGRRALTPDDVDRACAVLWRAWLVMVVIVALLATV